MFRGVLGLGFAVYGLGSRVQGIRFRADPDPKPYTRLGLPKTLNPGFEAGQLPMSQMAVSDTGGTFLGCLL